MKKPAIIFVFLLVGWSSTLFSMDSRFSKILNQTVSSVKQYEIDPAILEEGGYQICLRTGFGNAEFLNTSDLMYLCGSKVTQVMIVWTNYPADWNAQKALNLKRLQSLQAILPQVFTDTRIVWKLIRQTGCKTKEQASSYMHGIILAVKPLNPGMSYDLTSLSGTFERIKSGILEVATDSVWGHLGCLNPVSSPDTVVQNVLNRHKEWKEKLIVQDVTGSMNPYIDQVLNWHLLNSSEASIRDYVFFNDGDSTLNCNKKIGSTGGIYSVSAANLDSVVETLILAMSGGSGGDLEENNIEAILEGLKHYKKGGEVILIADNYATPRDTILASEIKQPIRIILCGAVDKINPAYLDLARQTGGSVHTIESDIEDLVKKKEGEIFKIGNSTYQLKKGHFVYLKTTSA